MSEKLTPIELDPVLHQPVRTRIVAYLTTRGASTFTELKQALAVTDGNLEAHMKKLTASNYVEKIRERGDGRPQTFYELTRPGKKAFKLYVSALQDLLPIDN